jgi:predicted DNA-binding transcriptional regulator AlpA
MSKRLLKMNEAAEYCGIGRDSFANHCPVQPIRVRPGQRGLRYDIRALDAWIDSLSDRNQADGQDATDWLAKLDGNHETQRRQVLRQ